MNTIDNPKLVSSICFIRDLKDFTGVIKDSTGNVAYLVKGLFERKDGPAVIFADGSVEYWIEGEELDCATDEDLELYV